MFIDIDVKRLVLQLKICNHVRQNTFISILESDSDHCKFHQSTQYHMAVIFKVCGSDTVSLYCGRCGLGLSMEPSVKWSLFMLCVQDPQDTKKESCSASSECAAVKARLDDCTARISSNGSTDETCEEELFDFLHCVDACVSVQIRVWFFVEMESSDLLACNTGKTGNFYTWYMHFLVSPLYMHFLVCT